MQVFLLDYYGFAVPVWAEYKTDEIPEYDSDLVASEAENDADEDRLFGNTPPQLVFVWTLWTYGNDSNVYLFPRIKLASTQNWRLVWF